MDGWADVIRRVSAYCLVLGGLGRGGDLVLGRLAGLVPLAASALSETLVCAGHITVGQLYLLLEESGLVGSTGSDCCAS